VDEGIRGDRVGTFGVIVRYLCFLAVGEALMFYFQDHHAAAMPIYFVSMI
jgi:hypothetical protein